MKEYLVFRLYAPLASWGEAAPGEIRPSATVPTCSALLGLLAAALGIRRDEEERLNAFNQHYHLAIHDLATQTRWLRDYHTVSAPRENKKRRYYTRRDELCQAPEEVGTIVSQREYRCDGYWHIAVSATAQAPYSLEQLRQALLEPHFPLYLGRKSCPLALPMQPEVRSGTLKEVFTEAAQALLSATAEALFSTADPEASQRTQQQLIACGRESFFSADGACYWDDPEESSLTWQQKLHENNQPLSRKRWQFGRYIRFCGTLQEGK